MYTYSIVVIDECCVFYCDFYNNWPNLVVLLYGYVDHRLTITDINADSFSKEICIIAISLEELSASVKLCLLLLNLCTISYFYRYLS